MSENPDLSAPPDSGLHDIAGLLAEQVASSHTAAARCFAVGCDEECSIAQREAALRLAARLMHASAAAANAIKRIQGGTFEYRMTVERVDYAAEKAARKAREEKRRAENPTLGELTEQLLDAEIASDMRAIRARLGKRAR